MDERKQWWLSCYAVTSMEKAYSTCQQLISCCADNEDRLFSPLSLAVHVYYARPFKRSRLVGRIREDIVPPSSRGIHRWLIHFRDGVMSHIDADKAEVTGRPMHDVVYSQQGKDKIFSTSDPRARITAYRDALAHFIVMRVIFMNRVRDFHTKFPHLLPCGDGDFLLNLDENSDLFIPHNMPVTEDLHYT